MTNTLTREVEDQARIQEFERQIVIGEKRIQELDHQIERLTALQDFAKRSGLGAYEEETEKS